jgi:hypothetical protein
MDKQQQLVDLDTAYEEFVQTVKALSLQEFLTPLGDWTTRDILAHFIGWNRITLDGCLALLDGQLPHYFYDGTNDYRIVNAGFFEAYPSKDRSPLIAEMLTTKDDLVAFLKSIDEKDWDRDTGVVHYRGGPATPARCVDSLIRDYRKHRQEIIDGVKK